jgi:shikimate kinase
VSEHVYLVGMMGAGKSSVGPLVARARGVPFLDLDAVVEAESGRSVAAWFADRGVEAFREAERAALRSLPVNAAVIATGGGTPTYRDNLDTMRARGRVVYLRAHPTVLVRRLRAQARPLLDGANDELARVGRLAAILAERVATYEQAHLIVDTEGASVQDVAARVAAALEDQR